jgi:hypothetical protein
MTARRLFPILVLLLWTSPALSGSDREFDATWHDGKAELDGYRLTVSRYGEERKGTAVLVYVTEPFSESKRVKVDDHTKNPSDTFNALKLNAIRDFQTGIYDYNTMVSVFVRSTDFSTAKVTFTSAEWCGHVYEELRFDPDRISGHYYSYFEDESGRRLSRTRQENDGADAPQRLLRTSRPQDSAVGEDRDPAREKNQDHQGAGGKIQDDGVQSQNGRRPRG